MRTKRNRINTAVMMVLSEGDIALPGDKTLEEPLNRIFVNVLAAPLLSKEQLGAIRAQFSSSKLSWPVKGCEKSSARVGQYPEMANIRRFPPESFQTGWGIVSRCCYRLKASLFGSLWDRHIQNCQNIEIPVELKMFPYFSSPFFNSVYRTFLIPQKRTSLFLCLSIIKISHVLNYPWSPLLNLYVWWY